VAVADAATEIFLALSLEEAAARAAVEEVLFTLIKGQLLVAQTLAAVAVVVRMRVLDRQRVVLE
jgi:hypothetical protein